MTKYKTTYRPEISENKDGSVYVLIVRVDRDGETRVIHGYKGRTLQSRRAAIISTRKYMKAQGLRMESGE